MTRRRRPSETCGLIRDERVIAIVRERDADLACRTVARLLAGGLRVVEVSLTTPGALEVIAEARAVAGDDRVIGAGTVMDLAAAEAAVGAGAELLVAPSFDPNVIGWATAHGVAIAPGCATPSEMVAAVAAGAGLIKLFPAIIWSPAAVRALLAALPELPLVPTGGVAPAEACDWLRAGAVAVGLGSSLGALDAAAVRRWKEGLR